MSREVMMETFDQSATEPILALMRNDTGEDFQVVGAGQPGLKAIVGVEILSKCCYIAPTTWKPTSDIVTIEGLHDMPGTPKLGHGATCC